MSAARSHRVAIIGGSFSGNKGAASMLQAVIDELPAYAGPSQFVVLTPYPDADAGEQAANAVRIVPWRPIDMLTSAALLPVVLMARALRLPPRTAAWTRGARALSTADVVVDVSGICFVDGRPLAVLVYNVLQVLIPRALGLPVVKAAQAMGPFRTQPNRLLARACLRGVQRLYARGETSSAHLDDLGVAHADAADLAFLLASPQGADDAAAVLLAEVPDDRDLLVVVPSEVVKEYCDGVGIDYVRTLAGHIDALVDELDASVVLLPHAVRVGGGRSRMNDLPVTAELAAAITRTDRLVVIDTAADPHVLRAVLSRARVVVTGRFHAMVSALATSTPVVVTGWSHKYREVLEEFRVAGAAVSFQDMEGPQLPDAVREAWRTSHELQARITQAQPAVRARAARSLEGVAELLVGSS